MGELIDVTKEFCKQSSEDNTPLEKLLLEQECWIDMNKMLEQFQNTLVNCKLIFKVLRNENNGIHLVSCIN